MTKQVVFTMKVEVELRDAFMAAAKAAQRPASHVMRELMLGFIQEHEQHTPEYLAYLHEAVEAGRASMRAGRGRSHEEVEADFAALRAQLKGAS